MREVEETSVDGGHVSSSSCAAITTYSSWEWVWRVWIHLFSVLIGVNWFGGGPVALEVDGLWWVSGPPPPLVCVSLSRRRRVWGEKLEWGLSVVIVRRDTPRGCYFR
jgi:hypothetical protein